MTTAATAPAAPMQPLMELEELTLGLNTMTLRQQEQQHGHAGHAAPHPLPTAASWCGWHPQRIHAPAPGGLEGLQAQGPVASMASGGGMDDAMLTDALAPQLATLWRFSSCHL